MIRKLWPVHVTDDQRDYNHSEIAAANVKEGARWADVAFHDERWRLPEMSMAEMSMDMAFTVVGTICLGSRRAVLSSISSLVGC